MLRLLSNKETRDVIKETVPGGHKLFSMLFTSDSNESSPKISSNKISPERKMAEAIPSVIIHTDSGHSVTKQFV